MTVYRTNLYRSLREHSTFNSQHSTFNPLPRLVPLPVLPPIRFPDFFSKNKKKDILRVYTLEATLLKKIALLACLFFRVKRPGINIEARVRS